jgi:hypothetical protein
MAGTAPHIPGCRDLSLIGERVARSLFSAVSDSLGRPVTVTVFPPLSEGRTREGFDRAAATAQRLGAHPSVLTIHEWGHAGDGRPWIITDPQPAESVDTLLTMDGPLEVERALQVGVLLAGAIETAHRAGIVHGDLSPARLVFGSHGEPLVAETGLAEFAVFPGLGALNNPVRYHAPPEVLERTEISPATDVYSLATTVYALLAGRAPQQKPAEITDSNASLLLRILQMAVPPIERPDLPPGLLDALRGPLSPNPVNRPQRAIDVAWLIQDVQRRAGFAVTEPVVLDLDDLAAGNQHAGPQASAMPVAAPAPTRSPHRAEADATAAWTAGIAPADPWSPTTSQPWAPAGASEPWEPVGSPDAWAPSAASAGAPDAWDAPGGSEPEAAPDPWAAPTGPGQGADTTWPPSGPGAGGGSGPAPEPFADPDLPSPTIFPFSEGLDAPASAGSVTGNGSGAPTSPGASPAGPLWPSQPPAEAPADALWPSTWPASDQRPDELPSWATPPANDTAANEPIVATGDDGGSIGDQGGLAPANGWQGPPATSDGVMPRRPAELDELPAWYTDPLPNAGDHSGANGTSGPNGATPPDAGHADLWEPPRVSNGHDAADERLPGSGDELRSLFGEIVGELDVPGAGHPPISDAGPTRESYVRPAADPEADPLGPPYDRPPIDRSELDTPLGPSPSPPRRGWRDTSEPEPPARLPRRHEANSWQGPPGAEAVPPGPPRLPRATEHRSTRPGDVGPRADTREPAARSERPAPRQVRKPSNSSAAMSGPPALPLLVLIGVVVVLVLGVAWLVITGDDAEAPASDRPPAGSTQDADGGDATGAGQAGVPTGVQAVQVPEGIQVTWTGAPDASYVVTVLSPDRPPAALPATLGTSVLVPNVDVSSGGGRCFTVAMADPQGAAGTPSDPACTPGASVEVMQGA